MQAHPLLRQDPESLIHVFLSLAYATEQSLGFNPNMRMVMDYADLKAGTIQYQIAFRNRKLQTVSVPLSDYKADFFMGRATRVFKVIDLAFPNKPPFALRMSWLPIGSTMEHERLEEIRKAVNLLGPQPYNLDPTRYWLSVELFGYNTIIQNGYEVADTTRLFAREEFTAPEFYPGYTELKQIVPLTTLKGVTRNHSSGHVYEARQPGSDSGLLDSTYVGDVKSYTLSHSIPRIHYFITSLLRNIDVVWVLIYVCIS